MDYIIVGTAGHVDHGKTVLVNALTGVNTDRLKEERERGISIELGFAPLTLPDGQKIGLVDVPGHERFIRQMLAGVGGMDLVMLVIAADEGIMPQTQEHLDIINLLQIKKGLVVVTKTDLVEEDWLELVLEDIKEALQDTVLADAPIVPVSAVTGAGMDHLKQVLTRLVAETPAKASVGKVRLPIDRVFSVTGFGTVVTGTLWTGSIRVGDVLELQPGGAVVRVRTLQVHGQKVEEAKAGQRVAVNLAGIEAGEVSRGSTLLTQGSLSPSFRVDVQLYLLPKAPALEHRQRVRIHLGTAEELGRVALLDRDELAPGETAFAQLQMETPLVAHRRDRLVIRSYSPMHTIAGGIVVDPVAPKHRRHDQGVLKQLATRLEGTPEELIMEALNRSGLPQTVVELTRITGMEPGEMEECIAGLLSRDELMEISFEGSNWVWPKVMAEKQLTDVRKLLEEYHGKYPLRPGFPKEELRSRMFSHWPVKVFNGVLGIWEDRGHLNLRDKEVKLPEFEAKPSPREEEFIRQILSSYREKLFQPPGWEDVVKEVKGLSSEKEELLHYLLGTGELVKVAEGLYFHGEAIETAKNMVRQLVQEKGEIQLATMRDAMGSSRKYVLPLLEYFDQIKFTKRIGDKRILF